jgi:hypothetical protein
MSATDCARRRGRAIDGKKRTSNRFRSHNTALPSISPLTTIDHALLVARAVIVEAWQALKTAIRVRCCFEEEEEEEEGRRSNRHTTMVEL